MEPPFSLRCPRYASHDATTLYVDAKRAVSGVAVALLRVLFACAAASRPAPVLDHHGGAPWHADPTDNRHVGIPAASPAFVTAEGKVGEIVSHIDRRGNPHDRYFVVRWASTADAEGEGEPETETAETEECFDRALFTHLHPGAVNAYEAKAGLKPAPLTPAQRKTSALSLLYGERDARHMR